MNCRVVQSKVSSYLDSELSGHEMLAIRGHLGQCAACEAEYERTAKLKRALAAIPAAEPTPEFETKLFATVLGQPVRPAAPVRPVWRVAAVTAMASALLVLTVLRTVDRGPASNQTADTRTFDVATDQALQGSLDPFGGSPVITVSNAGR